MSEGLAQGPPLYSHHSPPSLVMRLLKFVLRIFTRRAYSISSFCGPYYVLYVDDTCSNGRNQRMCWILSQVIYLYLFIIIVEAYHFYGEPRISQLMSIIAVVWIVEVLMLLELPFVSSSTGQ